MEKMNYTGHDIIFATGAPGSKWSRVLSLIGLHPDVNSSDKDKFPRYNLNVEFLSGKVIPVGNHTGAYFGPDNNIGEKFEDLTKLSKDEFIEEIKKPFDNWQQGIKIIKSHWFSYGENLYWLKENFPDAKIIMVYNGNEVAFKWWHFVGGWEISFPIYTWYNNDVRMYEKILKENQDMTAFAKSNMVPIKMHKNFQSVLRLIGLSDNLDFLNSLTPEDNDLVRKISFNEKGLVDQFNGSVRGAALGILSNNSPRCADLEEFENSINSADTLLAQRHNDIKVDEILRIRHGDDWLEQIDKIVASASFTDK
jgi:hypothetical protein